MSNTPNGTPLSFDLIEANTPDSVIDAALAGTDHSPYWLQHPDRPAALPALEGSISTDLLVVGGGYSGLWTALMAKERDPERSVV